ncbi:MAG TPA: DUF5335 domain-containing protein [Azospirillaceae bacterium]|nr:DUF5335 domain-containing protein [Azospirillaceae bacterium]
MARKLDKAEWEAYFDRMAKTLGAQSVDITIASPALGSQKAADWLPLIGITYDRKDDVLEVAAEGVDHLILHPREIQVEEEGGGLTALDVVDPDGNHQIVTLKAPLTLPPPA